jgi:acyl-CoA synthetase (NDP forming)
MTTATTGTKPPLTGLDAVFRARSIALVGLSADARKMTGAPLAILRQVGFAGEIHVVNPKYPEISGLKCWPDIESLPGAPDVALIMLGAASVPDAVRACGRKGIRAAVVLSSGFEESDDGKQLAAELRSAAAESGVLVIGPNCEGVWSVRDRVFLTFGSAAKRSTLTHAPIAILSQSGAMAGGVGRHLQENRIGCSYIVSVGNETVLTIADYLAWLLEQDDVRVLALFIEGVRDGERLLPLLERARRKGIRMVALKAGNSAAGQLAAASHTGKIASPHAIYRDLLEAAGVIQVESLTELIEAAEILSTLPLPPARGGASGHGGVSVFSVPGGTRALTADLFERHGVPLATFDPVTVKALAAALPNFGCTENPTDLTGQVLSHPGLFDQCLRIIASDPNTEAIVIQVANRGPLDVRERIAVLGEIAVAVERPIVVSFLGDAFPADDREQLRRAGIVCARDPAEASRYLGWIYAARRIVQREALAPAPAAPATATPARWNEAEGFLTKCGVSLPASHLLQANEDPAKACERLEYPVAIKALPEDADHKTEAGLVILNVLAPAALTAHAATLRARLGRADATLLVQHMVGDGIEVILSAIRNPDFGPVLAIGSGGIAVELYKDIAYVPLPADRGQVLRALQRLKLWTLLQGFRGRPGADVDALVEAALRFGSAFLSAQPAAAEIELNPVFVRPRGSHGATVVAVDVLVKRA